MHKTLYVIKDDKPEKAIIRTYGPHDFTGLIDIQRACFPPPFPEELWWSKEQLGEHVDRFQAGALCAEAGGRLIGSMTGLIVNMSDYGAKHSWEAVTDNGYIRNHNPDGDTLYVVDICVLPEYRKSGVGKWLMQSMYETVVQLGLERLLGGGRMPGYGAYADQLSPEEYVQHVISGKLKDPVVTFLMRCGRMPVGLAHDYLEDEQSRNCAVIMEWKNPFK